MKDVKLTCPSCGSGNVTWITFRGTDYPQCRSCKFWTTDLETWDPTLKREVRHGG